jgi:hypothetical protein
MKQAGHVIRVREKRNACRVLVRKLEGNINLESPSVGDRISIKNILKEQYGRGGGGGGMRVLYRAGLG